MILGAVKVKPMMATRSAAALAGAACLAVLAAGCAGHNPAPGTGAARSAGTSTTAAPAAPASTPAAAAPAGQPSAPRCNHQRHPAGHRTRSRRPELPVAGLLPPLPQGLTRLPVTGHTRHQHPAPARRAASHSVPGADGGGRLRPPAATTGNGGALRRRPKGGGGAGRQQAWRFRGNAPSQLGPARLPGRAERRSTAAVR